MSVPLVLWSAISALSAIRPICLVFLPEPRNQYWGTEEIITSYTSPTLSTLSCNFDNQISSQEQATRILRLHEFPFTLRALKITYEVFLNEDFHDFAALNFGFPFYPPKVSNYLPTRTIQYSTVLPYPYPKKSVSFIGNTHTICDRDAKKKGIPKNSLDRETTWWPRPTGFSVPPLNRI